MEAPHDDRPEGSVHVLSQPEPGRFPESLYAQFDERHFWCRARFDVCLRTLRAAGLRCDDPLRGFEIGCGTGVVRRQLENATAWTVDGADLEALALAENAVQRGETYLYDVHDRLERFRERYDVLVLFDVLEHIPDDEMPRFLESCLFHLRPGGFVCVNVPANPALWSRFDEFQGHRRRYRADGLRAQLEGAGLECIRVRYWGLSMVPVLRLRKRRVRRAESEEEIVRRGFRPPSAWVNALLGGVLAIEARVLSQPWTGTSVMALARKP
jgi:SAM-dependent methyltransferase